MNDIITVVVKRPGEKAEICQIPNALEAFQQLVGGYIERVPFTNDVSMFVDEQGRLRGLPYNVIGLRGPIVFYGEPRNGEENPVTLSDEQAAALITILG